MSDSIKPIASQGANDNHWHDDLALVRRHFGHKEGQSLAKTLESGVALGFEAASDVPSWVVAARGLSRFATRWTPGMLKPYAMPIFLTALSVPIFGCVGTETYKQIRDWRDARKYKNLCETAQSPDDFKQAGVDFEKLVERATASEDKLARLQKNTVNDNRSWFGRAFHTVAGGIENYAVGCYHALRYGVPATFNTIAHSGTAVREWRKQVKLVDRSQLNPDEHQSTPVKSTLSEIDGLKTQLSENAVAQLKNLTSVGSCGVFIGMSAAMIANPITLTAGIMGTVFSLPAFRQSLLKQAELAQQREEITENIPELQNKFTGAVKSLREDAQAGVASVTNKLIDGMREGAARSVRPVAATPVTG